MNKYFNALNSKFYFYEVVWQFFGKILAKLLISKFIDALKSFWRYFDVILVITLFVFSRFSFTGNYVFVLSPLLYPEQKTPETSLRRPYDKFKTKACSKLAL